MTEDGQDTEGAVIERLVNDDLPDAVNNLSAVVASTPFFAPHAPEDSQH